MSELNVEIVHKRGTLRLGDPAARCVVPEGLVLLHFAGQRPSSVTLDDESLEVSWHAASSSGYAQVDLTNRAGFHRVSVGSGRHLRNYDLETSTAKATWDDILRMAEFVVQNVFQYRRQFCYSLPSGQRRSVRLPQVEFGWLRERLPTICSLVQDIGRRPAVETARTLRVSMSGQALDVPRTLARLRERPDLLEPAEDGPIIVEEQRYWPSSVLARRKTRMPAAIEHAQIAAFLRVLVQSCNSLLAEVTQPARQTVSSWLEELCAARNVPVMRQWDRSTGRPAWLPLPTMLQRTDRRYRSIRLMQAEHMTSISPLSAVQGPFRTNVKDAWEVFQAFAAHMVGAALGLVYVSRSCDLRARDESGRSMTGGGMELYYDVRPDPTLLPAWRDGTDRPNDERPDIFLVDRIGNRVAILDVKFKVDFHASGHRARSEDLQEMQGYMQSYGLPSGAILFPGHSQIRVHSAAGNTLVELPLRPEPGGYDALLAGVREGLAHVWVNRTERNQ
jgi:hypothetical protein